MSQIKIKFPLMRNNIAREDLDDVINYLRSHDPVLTNGPKVKEFEAQWSNWLGVKYSVFVNSGSSANLISISLLKLKYPKGGEVIVPPLTWVSDIAAVLQNGFIPIFVDIDPQTLAMDTKQIIKKISGKTRAIFLTHVQGFDGLTDELLDVVKRKNIFLIEDVCESHGAKHGSHKAGTFGWTSNFSFYYAHHMTTIEGGMVCTNDEETYEYARMFRSHGLIREMVNTDTKHRWIKKNATLNPEFIFAFPAYNMRNTEIGGLMGLSQLKRLDDCIQKRNQNLEYFLSKIDASKYQTDFKLAGCSNYAFNLILKKKDKDFVKKLMNKMSNQGIEYRRGSAGGGNQLRQPYLKKIFPKNYYKNFPNTEHIHFYGFYIGNFPDLTVFEIDEILATINAV